MIKSRKDLYFYLHEDAKRNKIKNSFHYWIRLMAGFDNARAFRYIKCMRMCEYHYNNKKNPIHLVCYAYYRLRMQIIGAKYGIYIALNSCGYGLRLIHLAGGVILNANKIGNYCGFNSGVVIGNKGGRKRPSIGDYVAFGPGAKAFGDLTIGNNCFVAANAVVTKDMPNNSIIAGLPGVRIKEREPRNQQQNVE